MSRIAVLLKTNEGGMWVLPQIAELRLRGHVVTAIIPRGDGRLRRALDAASVPVVECPFDFSFRPSRRLLRGLADLRALLRETRPDVLFYHLYASALAARFASLGLPMRRVHMVAGPLYLESRVIRNAERFLCRLDHHLIAGSDYTARLYDQLGLSKRHMSTIPYGVDVTRFQRGPDQRTALFGCAASTFVVIMVAYVYSPKTAVFPGVGIKGHDVLLEAWASFSHEHADSLLVLVGGGFDSRGERHRQAIESRFGVAADPTIRWFDSVDDVREFYSSADLSVSPSLSENHGAALEAAAMSVPSIVSDAGGLPETITPASGWLVRAGDVAALTSALRTARREFAQGNLELMGAAARLVCEQKFSHAVVVPRVADVVGGHRTECVVASTDERS